MGAAVPSFMYSVCDLLQRLLYVSPYFSVRARMTLRGARTRVYYFWVYLSCFFSETSLSAGNTILSVFLFSCLTYA